MALIFPAPAQIKNLLDPTDNTDAATKQYVDNVLSGGTIDINVGNVVATGNVNANIILSNTITATGNLVAENANLGNLVVANYISGNGSLLTSINGSNVTGTVANANYAAYAGNVTRAAQSNITSVGTLTGLTSNGIVNFTNTSNVTLGNISNIHISGGTSGYVLQTDGSGGLSWADTSHGTGNANISGSNTQVFFNNNGSNTLGTSANLTFNTATSILTVTGNIVASNANLGNLVTANYFSGNGSSITGLRLNDSQFTDVSTTTPTSGQILSYNGTYWTNKDNTSSVSAGPGVGFWFSTPILNTQNANSDIQIDSLSTTPNTAAQTYANVTINGTAALCGLVSPALGRTILDAGNWDFSLWANVDSISASTSTINCGIHQVLPNATSVTITGTGTSRTVTASSGTPFATVVAGSDVLLSSYIQTSLGMYRVTAKTSDTVVTINTPSTYTNQTSVAASVWIPLFNVGSATLASTSFTEYLFGTTQPEYAITTDSAIGVLLTATTTKSRSIYVTINGTTQASHFSTPLHILHKDLAGLQGGSSTEYYHLTNTEYTGTGTGTFVRNTSPTISNLSVTGNVAATGNISASYFIGNGSQLTGMPTLDGVVDEFTGDGSTTAFTLSVTPSSKRVTFVVVQGVMQPKSSYSVSGTTLTFGVAPPNTSFIEVTTMKLA